MFRKCGSAGGLGGAIVIMFCFEGRSKDAKNVRDKGLLRATRRTHTAKNSEMGGKARPKQKLTPLAANTAITLTHNNELRRNREFPKKSFDSCDLAEKLCSRAVSFGVFFLFLKKMPDGSEASAVPLPMAVGIVAALASLAAILVFVLLRKRKREKRDKYSVNDGLDDVGDEERSGSRPFLEGQSTKNAKSWTQRSRPLSHAPLPTSWHCG